VPLLVASSFALFVKSATCPGSTKQPCTAGLSHRQHVMSWHLRLATVADVAEACVTLILYSSVLMMAVDVA
jgi:hypothetical protein